MFIRDTLHIFGKIFFLTTYVKNSIKVCADDSCPDQSVIYHGYNYTLCYWVTPDKYYPNAGNAECQKDGGIIGEIRDEDAQNFLKCALPPISEQSLWIGYNDISIDGTFVTWTGDLMPWHNMEGGPSDPWGDEDCIEFYVNVGAHVMWQWNDRDCSSAQFRILCSKSVEEKEHVGRAYDLENQTDSAYFTKVSANHKNELGVLLLEMTTRSDKECLVRACLQDGECLAAHYDTEMGLCQALTCPKMEASNMFNISENSNVWVMQNRVNN